MPNDTSTMATNAILRKGVLEHDFFFSQGLNLGEGTVFMRNRFNAFPISQTKLFAKPLANR